MTRITKEDIRRAESQVCNSLLTYGENNMATIRAQIALRELRDAYAKQRKGKAATT